jgi:hypothetical protein
MITKFFRCYAPKKLRDHERGRGRVGDFGAVRRQDCVIMKGTGGGLRFGGQEGAGVARY